MLAQSARKIFEGTLLRVDSKDAVRRAVKIETTTLSIFENKFELNDYPSIYVVAIGKAAYPMAVGFSEVAGEFVKGGVVSGVIPENELDEKWQVFAGGHPLPNEESLASARACLELLKKADQERALVIFLISGGGSAMMDLPRSEKISLADLRESNHILVTCGAAIAEINAVRRAISQVKGGGLALLAPNAEQISLIISDTSKGDISSVASGPSLLPAKDIPDALQVVEKYDLKSKLPSSVTGLLEAQKAEVLEKSPAPRAYVLLDNEYMIRQAAQIAEKIGFVVKIDDDPDDDFIAEGCEKLFSRFIEFRKAVSENRPICFLSGGEFGCKVFGNGIGGRNCETVLRLALSAQNEPSLSEYAILSAGTDGIDGNSPSAGAVADKSTFERAGLLKMNPLEYLQNSDSFSFFDRLNDSIMTGATGTNVRDIRILLAE
jgi:glycerate 2-kinase